jgi:tungsten cofactor oxidoreducase radical SAM maturase
MGTLYLRFKDYTVALEDKANLEKVYIEITTFCNLNCKMCFRRFWKDKLREMSEEEFNLVLKNLEAFPNLKTVYFGGIGEPLVHPKILSFIELAKKKNYRVEFGTNGTLLHKYAENLVNLGVDKIIVSIDAPEKEIFEDIRGTDFGKIEDNILYLQQTKKSKGTVTPEIWVETVLMKSNINSIYNIFPLLDKLGVTTLLLSNLMPFSKELSKEILYDGNFDDKKFIDDINNRIGKYKVKVIYPKFKLLTDRKCQFIENHSTVIGVDLGVYPCYRLLHTYTEYIFGREKIAYKYSFGSLKEKTLFEIWNSDEYKRFRYNVENALFPSCTDCPLQDVCDFCLDSNSDCFGNMPSCADCLWYRGIIQCP